jgi:hypothetical protein
MDKIPFLCARKSGALLHAVSSLESLDTTGGVNKLLLAGKERVTGGTNFSRYLGFGGTGLECIAAQAFYGNLIILGMQPFFHNFPPCTARTADSSDSLFEELKLTLLPFFIKTFFICS